jgi:hypothetical protein
MAIEDSSNKASIKHAKATGGTAITRDSSNTRTIKISPEGKTSSRPVSDKWKIVTATTTVGDKTTVEKHAIPNKNSKQGTQKNHTVTSRSNSTRRVGGGAGGSIDNFGGGGGINWETK